MDVAGSRALNRGVTHESSRSTGNGRDGGAFPFPSHVKSSLRDGRRKAGQRGTGIQGAVSAPSPLPQVRTARRLTLIRLCETITARFAGKAFPANSVANKSVAAQTDSLLPAGNEIA